MKVKFIILLFLISCYTPTEELQIEDGGLQILYDWYLSEADHYEVNPNPNNYTLAISFADLEFPLTGKTIKSGNHRWVIIDKYVYIWSTEIEMQGRFLHEIGHALWNMEHDENFIMQQANDWQEYESNQIIYNKEFFR